MNLDTNWPTGNTDPNAFLMGGGSKSAKFENIGDGVAGTVLDVGVHTADVDSDPHRTLRPHGWSPQGTKPSTTSGLRSRY